MKKTIATAGAIVLAAGAAFAGGHGDTVRMGTEGAYPPYNFLNDDGEVDGYERELGDELCARAELTCEWVTNDWDSIIPNLVQGNYDTIIAGMSITDERKEVIAFSDNYLPPSASLYLSVMEDVDFEGGVIAAQTGTIQAAYVADSGAELVEFATPDDTVAAVQSGEVDAVLADADFLLPLAEQNGDMMIVGEPVLLGDGIGIGMRKSDEELKAKFDAAIASMKEDGTINELIVKWFGDDADTFE